LSRPFREEVLNVKLAELLSRQKIISVPETIIAASQGRRLPDVIIADYWGVRVVLEGKVSDTPHAQELLDKMCKERVEEAIGSIAIAVIYPSEVRSASWQNLEVALSAAHFRIKVYTATTEGDWSDSTFGDLSDILRRAYESLVAEDVVNKAVDMLGNSIEIAADALSRSKGTEGRFREILVVPKSSD
jgi:hypothetical protein